MSSFISTSNNSLESGSLTCLSLFLYRQNAHNLIEEFIALSFSILTFLVQKFVNYLSFFDWDRMSIDFFNKFDVSEFHQSTEFS